ncbi:hypothetical protein NL676_010595 [Syzygium grande]|nr:hypothetical protein NL676_010595 [Syzygium grande]
MKNVHEASCHQSIHRNVGGACRRPNVVSLSGFDSRQLTFKKRLLGVVGRAPPRPALLSPSSRSNSLPLFLSAINVELEKGMAPRRLPNFPSPPLQIFPRNEQRRVVTRFSRRGSASKSLLFVSADTSKHRGSTAMLSTRRQGELS